MHTSFVQYCITALSPDGKIVQIKWPAAYFWFYPEKLTCERKNLCSEQLLPKNSNVDGQVNLNIIV